VGKDSHLIYGVGDEKWMEDYNGKEVVTSF
jgi:hypothetical protein